MQVLKVATNSLVEELEETMFQMALGKRKITETEKIIQKDQNGKQTTKIREVIKRNTTTPNTSNIFIKEFSTRKMK